MELYSLYSLPIIIRVIKLRRMRWAEHIAHMWKRRVLMGQPEGRRPHERPNHRWKDDIKMDLREVGWEAWTGSIWLKIGTGGGLV
jgi:hypothetical protein